MPITEEQIVMISLMKLYLCQEKHAAHPNERYP